MVVSRRVPLTALAALGFALFIAGLLAYLSPSLPLPSVAHAGAFSNAFNEIGNADTVAVHSSELTAEGNTVAVVAGENDGPGADIDNGPLADHTDRPTVRIKNVMPEVGEEGRSVTVTLKLSRPLTEDEKYCYEGTGTPSDETRRNYVCIEGSVVGRDSYQDHLHAGESPIPPNIGHKFVFFAGQTEKRLSIGIDDDECITPNRQIVFWLYGPYQDHDKDGSGTIEDDETVYGYDFNPEATVTVRVIGDDDDDAPEDLWPVVPSDYEYVSSNAAYCENDGTGVTEDGDYNRAPLFSDQEITISVGENTHSGRAIGDPVTADDPENDTLTYSLTGDDASSFDINSSTGQIRTDAALDYETKDTYHLAVQVRDGKGLDGNADTNWDHSVDVTITVDDVNEPPEFVNQPTTLNVVENTGSGVDIGDPISATDPDEDPAFNSLTYSLGGADSASFDFDTYTGQIITKGGLDKETQSSYSVTVSVTDGKDAQGNADDTEDATHAVTIRVTDKNDVPAFKDENGDVQTSTTRSVAENTAPGQPIGKPVAATDDDSGDTLTYSLEGTDAAKFDIDSGTGQIRVKDDLNYEGGTTSYSVAVSVHDGKDDADNGDTTVDATIDVTINVTDVEEAPEFVEDTPTTRSVSEDAGVNDNIGNAVSATDGDGDTLAYTLLNADTLPFKINDSSGQLSVKEALDHETKSSYTVTVTVTDRFDATGATDTSVDDTITVTITVNNVFEAPRFDEDDDSGTATRSIPENTGERQIIGAPVSATDDEGDKLTYRLGGADDTSFFIDTTTGQLLTSATLDHETKDTYHVTVWVSDGKDTNGDTEDTTTDDTSINVTIVVTDVNEKPVFNLNLETEPSIAENTAADTNIGTPLSATDEDENETLTYGLTGTDAAFFDIDTDTGQIKTKADLDHESRDTYSVTVTVSDGRNDAGDNEQTPVTDATIAVTITVTNVDEEGAVTLSTQHPGVDTAVTATLEDPDGEISVSAITWKWEKSTDKTNWTVIGGETTNRYTPQSGDVGNHLQATATYTDPNVAGSGETSVSAATDNKVRENAAPVFNPATATRSVAENTPPGRNIGDPVTATDSDTADSANDEALTYSLSGTDAASFSIVPETGQLQTKASLDYERKRSYSVVVTATDTPGATATITVTISVTDVNEAPRRRNLTPLQVSFSQSSYSVNENDDVTITVNVSPNADRAISVPITFGGTAESSDYTVTGLTNNELAYTSGASSANFTITAADDSDTGEETIDLGFGTLPDSVSEGTQATASVTISVATSTPSNTGLQVSFSQSSYSVDEGDDVTITVQASPAADRAINVPITFGGTADSLDYSVSGLTNNELAFTSGASSARFTITAADDSDTGEETIDLGFGTLPDSVSEGTRDTASVTISVATSTPSNTALEVSFSQSSYSVDEGGDATITVQVSPAADRNFEIPVAVEGDTAESSDYTVTGLTNGKLAFTSGDSSATFTIETVDDSDRSDEIVDLSFGQLPDDVNEGTQATSELTINDTTPVPNNNRRSTRGNGGGIGSFGGSFNSFNNPPVFTEGGNAERYVPEDAANPSNVGSPVTATDADGDILVYTLGGPDAASFTLDSATGQLKTAIALDYETKSSYHVIMYVYDTRGGRDTIVVNIRVTDVAEEQAVVQAPVPTPEPQPVATPTPEPTATATATPQPTAAPAPTPAPTPEPTAALWLLQSQWPAPTATPVPLPTATPEPTVTAEPTSTPDLSGNSQSAMFTQFQGGGPLGDFQSQNVKYSVSALPEEDRYLRIWPIILMAIGIAMMVVSIGMLISEGPQKGEMGNRDSILNS